MTPSNKVPSPRPGISHSHSHYVEMLLQQDDIPRLHNILAALFVWLLLAGFLVFPGAFNDVQKSIPTPKDETDSDTQSSAQAAAQTLLKGLDRHHLLIVGAVVCGAAAIGILGLAIRHRQNYVWLINRLFVPGMANSLAGIISTLIGVYSQQGGVWGTTAIITAGVIALYFGTCGFLWALIEMCPLRRIRKRHGTHYEGWIQTEVEGRGEKGAKVNTNKVVVYFMAEGQEMIRRDRCYLHYRI